VGRHPLGLCLVYPGVLTPERGTSIRSCRISSSLRIMYTFPGLSPEGEDLPESDWLGGWAMLKISGESEIEVENLLQIK